MRKNPTARRPPPHVGLKLKGKRRMSSERIDQDFANKFVNEVNLQPEQEPEPDWKFEDVPALLADIRDSLARITPRANWRKPVRKGGNGSLPSCTVLLS